MLDPMQCECLSWARGRMDEPGHSDNCPHHPKNLTALLGRLVRGIEEWASNEDGVPDWLWGEYHAAKLLLAPVTCKYCGGKDNHGSQNPALYKGDTCSGCGGAGVVRVLPESVSSFKAE